MIYRFGDCEFNTHCHTLRHADRLLQLRPKVLRVLTYLLEHADRVVTREELCAEVWPCHHISNATLESTLRAVRQAIGDSGRTPHLIQTIYGSGYRFVAAIETLPDEALPASPGIAPGSSLPAMASGDQQLVTLLCGSLPHAIALSTQAGLATFTNVMHLVYEHAYAEVHRYGGTLLYVAGVSLMAMFGAALAETDHAQRAVMAALKLYQALHAPQAILATSPTAGLDLRLGLHTGPVHVGGVGDTLRSPPVVIGDTAILAAAVAQTAEPGTIVCSDATACYAQEVGDLEVVRPLWIEGRSTPCMLYRIVPAMPGNAPVEHQALRLCRR
jgi:DNA-binding winged helix-turn-helix (wHTH) protein